MTIKQTESITNDLDDVTCAHAGKGRVEGGLRSCDLLDLMVQCGYTPAEVHPECYRGFSWTTFCRQLIDRVRAVPPTRDGAEGAGLPPIDDALHTPDVIASLQERAFAPPKPAPSLEGWVSGGPPADGAAEIGRGRFRGTVAGMDCGDHEPVVIYRTATGGLAVRTVEDFDNRTREALLQSDSEPAPSPAVAAEAIAWQFRQRSGVGKGPQSQAPWGEWCGVERADYESYLRAPNKLIEVRALYASPPVRGDRDREAIANSLIPFIGNDVFGVKRYAAADAILSTPRSTPNLPLTEAQLGSIFEGFIEWKEFEARNSNKAITISIDDKDQFVAVALGMAAVQSGAGERTPEQEEISKCWQRLEESGFPPEASGWPFQSIKGALPDAIDAALDCLIRQRENLLSEVQKLRQAPHSSSETES